MNYLVYPNQTYPETVAYAQTLIEFLDRNGHRGILPENFRDEEIEMIIVIGGDGTVLRAIRQYYDRGFPFWSINGGHLGYLTECQLEDADVHLQRILQRDFMIEERIMMRGCLHSNDGDHEFYALNEAVIHRSGYTHALHLDISVTDIGLLNFGGDGILISTPTGSTAYNLAAGGPILLPIGKQMVITPICPHAALCPPIVVPAKERILVNMNRKRNYEECDMPSLVIDGCVRMTIHPGDVVECTGDADHKVRFVHTSHDSFYKKLQQRMASNE